MPKKLILFYTSGKKPFVEEFYFQHREQAERVGADFICVSSILWDGCDESVILQNPLRCQVSYAGIYEAVLQALEGVEDDRVVFLAEDDCLYLDARFDQLAVALAEVNADLMIYQQPVSFIGPAGFYTPHYVGPCLHSAYGTAAAIRHNMGEKWREFNGETGFPISTYEPLSYPSLENPDEANRHYRTMFSDYNQSVSLDFRGYGNQTWAPDGTEKTWQTDAVWGDANVLWSAMITGV